MRSLAELQRAFLAAIAPAPADGERPPVDPALLRLVNGRGALTAPDRLAIYAEMYEARLVDVLREDFARTVAVVGDETFRALARRYLARHPSEHPSVCYVGRRFAAFVAADPSAPPFLGDLAQLEWARADVFDAADATPLSLGDLAEVAAAQWPALTFGVIPACRVIECAWPVHEIWDAAGREDDEPIRSAPAPTALRVWREGFAVSHAAMSDLEARALGALRRGESFARLCEVAAGETPTDEAAPEVGRVLLRWIEDGLLVRAAS